MAGADLNNDIALTKLPSASIAQIKKDFAFDHDAIVDRIGRVISRAIGFETLGQSGQPRPEFGAGFLWSYVGPDRLSSGGKVTIRAIVLPQLGKTDVKAAASSRGSDSIIGFAAVCHTRAAEKPGLWTNGSEPGGMPTVFSSACPDASCPVTMRLKLM